MRFPDEGLKQKRRQHILTVSAKLFAEKNYHQVLMDEVARKAGLAKGSIYNYFSTKEDLYISIITNRLESLLRLLKERIDTKQTPLINLRRIIIHIYSFMAKYPDFFQIWYREKLNCKRPSHHQIQIFYREIKKLLQTALLQGIESGMLRPHDPDFVVDVVLGVIDAAVIRSPRLDREGRRRERLQSFEFVLNSLGTENACALHAAGADEPHLREKESFVTSE